MNLLTPDEGQIFIDGKTIFDDSYSFKISVAYIPDSPLYYNELTVYEHIKFIAMAYNLDLEDFNKRLNVLCKKYNVEKYMDCYFNELSKGTKQKILIIIALIRESKILLLAEPFSGLDVLTVDELIVSLMSLKENGYTIIISTHNIEIIDQIMDNVLILRDSEQVIFEDINTLKQKLQTDNLNTILKNFLKEGEEDA